MKLLIFLLLSFAIKSNACPPSIMVGSEGLCGQRPMLIYNAGVTDALLEKVEIFTVLLSESLLRTNERKKFHCTQIRSALTHLRQFKKYSENHEKQICEGDVNFVIEEVKRLISHDLAEFRAIKNKKEKNKLVRVGMAVQAKLLIYKKHYNK